VKGKVQTSLCHGVALAGSSLRLMNVASIQKRTDDACMIVPTVAAAGESVSHSSKAWSAYMQFRNCTLPLPEP